MSSTIAAEQASSCSMVVKGRGTEQPDAGRPHVPLRAPVSSALRAFPPWYECFFAGGLLGWTSLYFFYRRRQSGAHGTRECHEFLLPRFLAVEQEAEHQLRHAL